MSNYQSLTPFPDCGVGIQDGVQSQLSPMRVDSSSDEGTLQLVLFKSQEKRKGIPGVFSVRRLTSQCCFFLKSREKERALLAKFFAVQ